MAIVETKADQLIALIDRKKEITTTDAAKELNASEEYVRRVAKVLHKNNLLELKPSAFKLTMSVKT